MNPLALLWLKIVLVAGSYAFLTWPAGKLIGWLMRRWATPGLPTDEGNLRIGRHIGYVERLLVFTFILGNHYDALGLLLAAKSILRVSDERARQQTEYILLGTLLSVTTAVLLALAGHLVWETLG